MFEFWKMLPEAMVSRGATRLARRATALAIR
jgi:hypothetical protein